MNNQLIRSIALFAFAACASFGQTVFTSPPQIITGTSDPATCTAGQIFQNTAAALGSQFKTCSAGNVWTASSGSGTSVTTKGDLQGFSTVAARIPVGADGTILTADSTQALGVKWASSSCATCSYTLASSGVASSTTNSTTEVNLAVVTLPANTLGANSSLTIKALYKMTSGGSPNSRTPIVRLTATSGAVTGGLQVYNNSSASSTLSFQLNQSFWNANATNSQVAVLASGNSSSTIQTAAIDTTATSFIDLNCALTNAGDSCQLISYSVTVNP